MAALNITSMLRKTILAGQPPTHERTDTMTRYLPPDAIREAGEALHGSRWQSALARDLLMATSRGVRAWLLDEAKCAGPSAAAILWLLRAKGYERLADRLEGRLLDMPQQNKKTTVPGARRTGA